MSVKPIEKELESTIFGKYNTSVFDASANISARISPDEDEVPDLFKKYEYPVSAWPVLIDKESSGQLNRLCTNIPKLIRQIPALYFKNDVSKIADFYFGGNQMLAQFALMCHNKNIEVGCRLDLTMAKDGFKILEVNIGSSIGGWQVQSFESIIRKLHPQLSLGDGKVRFESRNTQHLYIKFLIDKIVQQVTFAKDEINVFISLGHIDDDQLRQSSLAFFNSLLQKELQKRGFKGQAYTGKATDLKLIEGRLYHENKNIHSVLILNMDAEEISPDTVRGFITDKVYLPDHLGTSIAGDKRNLALLRELASQGKFSAENNDLILMHIPWTSGMKEGGQSYNNSDDTLPELLANDKDRFVIKAAAGYQGKDVFIGKFTNDEEWASAIKTGMEKGGFIAQEYNESVNFLAPSDNNEWTAHKLIWGAFGFGETYGGVWVRMSPVKTDVGVINSATGAVEAIVYECLED